jgi:hypothetical protein
VQVTDPPTIYEFWELQCRLHAAEGLMERAAEAIDHANALQGQEAVSSAAIAVVEVHPKSGRTSSDANFSTGH